jgi:hypothetical protein
MSFARFGFGVGDRLKSVVRVWELGGEPKPRDYHTENVLSVGWSPDGEPLAVSLEKGDCRIARGTAWRGTAQSAVPGGHDQARTKCVLGNANHR